MYICANTCNIYVSICGDLKPNMKSTTRSVGTRGEEGCAFAAEPPQDARCTFCVNIWNDFEIMIGIFRPGDARGISRVLGRLRFGRERAVERKMK